MLRLSTMVALMSIAVPALAQTPGTLISAEPATGAPSGTRAWRIRYWTDEPRRGPLPVTGMVVAPDRPARGGGRPVLAWTHGTWGVAESCGPSLSPGFFKVTAALQAVGRGYTVVAPDYPGLGSAGPHPYLVGDSAGRATLDAVRAARQLAEAGAGSRFAVWGESQGGHAALFTGEVARRYAPELTLVGIAAAAPPTDLGANLTATGGTPIGAFLTAYVASSWSDYYGIPLKAVGRPRTARLIDGLAKKCISLDSKPKLLTVLGIAALSRDLKGVSLARTAPWSRYVRSNSVAAQAAAPVLIAQSVQDPLVSPPVTRAFARRLCASGARVRWIDIPGGKHETSAADSAPATLDWIDARFAGRVAPNDCKRL